MTAPRALSYVTDVEGRWEKLEGFTRDNPDVTLDREGRLQVRDGALFVFGGDAVDRGPHSRRLVAALLDAKRRQPDRVVLIAGNRDINKLRLARELHGLPPRMIPDDLRRGPRGPLLRWILEKTMGAAQAFEHRRAELVATGQPSDDEAVATSFADDVAEGGPLAAYLAECQLGVLVPAADGGQTLVVHGAVTPENLGVVPGEARATPDDVPGWIERLNRFYTSQLQLFLGASPKERLGDRPAWRPIVDYQAPILGTQQNQASVIYGRPTDARGNPHLPGPDVVRRLKAAGVRRVLVGHTPAGDCPALIRAPGLTLVMADNSYGRVEGGSRVRVDADGALTASGLTVLDDGTRAEVVTTLDEASPLGLRDETGALVKARLARGDYLLFKALGGHGRLEQTAAASEELARRRLDHPWPGA